MDRGETEAKIQLFQNMVNLHIKLKGMMHERHGTNSLTINFPRILGWGLKFKIQLFQNMVMLHDKLKGIANAATYNYILCPFSAAH